MIIKTLKDIARLLEKSRIPYMVVGGQAIIVYGRTRLTQDIDITVALTPEEHERLLNAVVETFRVLPKDAKRFVRETWVLPLEHMETKVRVDIVFSITPFERQAMARAREILIEDVPVKYISPEDLVVQKIIAGRTKDLEDAKGVIEVQGDKITIAKVENKIKALAREEEGRVWLGRWRKLKMEHKGS